MNRGFAGSEVVVILAASYEMIRIARISQLEAKHLGETGTNEV
jgi:hypothetical protein